MGIRQTIQVNVLLLWGEGYTEHRAKGLMRFGRGCGRNLFVAQASTQMDSVYTPAANPQQGRTRQAVPGTTPAHT